MIKELSTRTMSLFGDLSLPHGNETGDVMRGCIDTERSSAPVEEPEVPDAPTEPLPERDPDESPRIEPDPEDTPIPHPSPARQPGTEPVPDRIPSFCPWRAALARE
jgi:hypothetical protein